MSKDALTPAIAVLVDSFKPEDFEIDCDGCTACCRGHDGVKLDDDEVGSYTYACHKDDKGEWRLDQVDGACIYLDDDGCQIHSGRERTFAYAAMQLPRRCREFDCRAAVIFFGSIGIDELVREAKLPLAVVEQGRAKLAEWNNQMNLRALSGGADLSFLVQDQFPGSGPSKGDDNETT